MTSCLRPGGDIPENMSLRGTNIAKIDNRSDAHSWNYMYKKKNSIELLDINRIMTRARASPLFNKTSLKCKRKIETGSYIKVR